jgi:hypothetical protein
MDDFGNLKGLTVSLRGLLRRCIRRLRNTVIDSLLIEGWRTYIEDQIKRIANDIFGDEVELFAFGSAVTGTMF